MCRWFTVIPASSPTLKAMRKPLSETPSSFATRDAVMNMRVRSGPCSPRTSFTVPMCSRGMTRKCRGAGVTWWSATAFFGLMIFFYIFSANVANSLGDAWGYRWGLAIFRRAWEQHLAARSDGSARDA